MPARRVMTTNSVMIFKQQKKGERSYVKSQGREKICLMLRKGGYWDFHRSLVDNARSLVINLKGKNLELSKEYKNIFGEQRLASDLVLFQNDAQSIRKSTP